MEWKFAKSRIQGRSHEKAEPPIKCQDYYYPENTEEIQKNGIYAIVLADGAGSAPYAHFGSQTTVKAVFDYLCNEANFESLCRVPYLSASEADEIKNNLRNEIIEKLNLEKERLSAEYPDVSLKSLASTLLFAAIKEDKYVVGHIGDGFIAALYENEGGKTSAEPVSMPENGRFVNETFFVTDENMTGHLRLSSGNLETEKGIITSFALMSDGTADVLWMKKERKFRDGLDKLMSNVFNNNAETQNYLSDDLLPKIKNVTSDDCSIIIVSRKYEKKEISFEEEYKTASETKDEPAAEQNSEIKTEMTAETDIEKSSETSKTENSEENI